MAEVEVGDGSWKGFLRKHWTMVALFFVAAILAVVGAVFVFLWFVGDAQATGLVPSTLGLWSLGHLVAFLLWAILWEVLFIGIPVIVAAAAGWMWWKRLLEEEKKGYHFFGSRSRATSGGGGVSLLVFIAFCVKVYLDGNWNVAIATWTFDYLVYSVLWTLIWIVVIFGIPIAIGILWWINHVVRKNH